ncbi:MAG: hypothetical protein CVU39_04905 [Chloroflexi bacterium HGW-Chloroflexi-10]|nr:MAG: hypothetical protein CVU39_04905 [Chloroflexi bacterium HGW-Chloroflexi-10]
MKRGLYNFIGILLILAALAGLAISVTGIIGIWRIENAMKTSFVDTLDLLDDTLQATADGITVADQSLSQGITSINTLTQTIETTGKSVEDSIPLVDTFTQMTILDLPKTIETTQEALESAQSSAAVIDTTLALLTTIPYSPITSYDNTVPLGDALGEVSVSLDALPISLATMEKPLEKSKENLTEIGTQITTMATDIQEINNSLTNARKVTTQYQGVISTLQQQLALTRQNLPGQLEMISWFLTVALVWLGLTQIGLLMQGFEMMGLDFERHPEEENKTKKEG